MPSCSGCITAWARPGAPAWTMRSVRLAEELAGRIRLLAFDEMQITDIADAMIVGRLFQRLFDGGVTLVTTSNRHPDDLYDEGLNRHLFLPFIEMIKTRCVVWELASETDHRQGKYHGAQSYFHPAIRRRGRRCATSGPADGGA